MLPQSSVEEIARWQSPRRNSTQCTLWIPASEIVPVSLRRSFLGVALVDLPRPQRHSLAHDNLPVICGCRPQKYSYVPALSKVKLYLSSVWRLFDRKSAALKCKILTDLGFRCCRPRCSGVILVRQLRHLYTCALSVRGAPSLSFFRCHFGPPVARMDALTLSLTRYLFRRHFGPLCTHALSVFGTLPLSLAL
jgi:hypothetical protein